MYRDIIGAPIVLNYVKILLATSRLRATLILNEPLFVPVEGVTVSQCVALLVTSHILLEVIKTVKELYEDDADIAKCDTLSTTGGSGG